MPFAGTSTGATLFYEHLNEGAGGDPVIVLHGLLGTGRKDLGHMLDWLAALGYEVIAPTFRGYGQSTPKPRTFPFQFYKRDAKDILTFLDALNIQKCHILGYSDGGEVALICAGTAPEKFASVTTIGSVGYMGPDVRPVVMSYRLGSQWMEPYEIEMHNIDNPDRFAAGWVRSMVQLIDSGGDVAVSLAQNITMPLLMMLGKKDKLNPQKYAEIFLEGVDGGRLEMFDAGHPVHDHQTEQFKAVLLDHLQNTSFTS